jgi:arylsulfatase A
LGINPPRVHLDGSDISPVLKQEGTFKRHQPLFWHLQRSKPIVAMRDGDYSLVAERDYDLTLDNMFEESWIPTIKSGAYTHFQLYDLVNDRAQTTDIAAKHPDIVARMKQQLIVINNSIMSDGPGWHLRH